MAIDVHELRVGNLIDYKGSIIEVDLGFFHSWAINSLEYEWEKLKPIPLSGEILIALGFKAGKSKGVTRMVDDVDDIDPKDKHKYTYYWDLRLQPNIKVEGLSSFNLVQWGKGTPIFFTNQWLRIEVSSLHQLMNLFHSLTQTELSYSPPQ